MDGQLQEELEKKVIPKIQQKEKEQQEEQPPATTDKIEDITNDFENKLLINAEKEKQTPPPPQAEDLKQDENIENDFTPTDSSGFNILLVMFGILAVIGGIVAYFVFKDDDKNLVKTQPQEQPQAPVKKGIFE